MNKQYDILFKVHDKGIVCILKNKKDRYTLGLNDNQVYELKDFKWCEIDNVKGSKDMVDYIFDKYSIKDKYNKNDMLVILNELLSDETS